MNTTNLDERIIDRLTQNSIAFQNKFCLLPEATSEEARVSSQTAAVIQAELINLGYILDESAYSQLCRTSDDQAIQFHHEVIEWIRLFLGSDNYQPLYDGFPRQVMELSDEELFTNAIRHYWSGGTFIPNSYTQSRPSAFEHDSYTTITAGDDQRLRLVFTDLMSANQSLSPLDAMIRDWFMREYPTDELRQMLPKSIPFKENLCVLVAATGIIPASLTTTDALRVIVYKSNGDITLPKPTQPIGKFSRSERRQLLEMLESINLCPAEMLGQEVRWKHVGEVLHPGEYAKRYPKTFAAFDKFRNGKVVTWLSQVVNEPDLQKKTALLSQRPGYFARQLDSLLRQELGVAPMMSNYYQQHITEKEGIRRFNERVNRILQSRRRFIDKLESTTQACNDGSDIASSRLEELFNLYWQGQWEFESSAGDDLHIYNQSVIRNLAELNLKQTLAMARLDKIDFMKEYTQYQQQKTAQCQQHDNCQPPQTPEEEPANNTESNADGMTLNQRIDFILHQFDHCADGISAKVLYELYTHFEDRRYNQHHRNIMIRNDRKLVELSPLPALDGEIIDRVEQTILHTLKRRFSKLNPLGRCWIDPQLKNFPLPTNLRSITVSQKPIIRGLRLPISNPNASVVRFYVHWKDERGTEDLDLSATFIGKDNIEVISWCSNMNTPFCCHSGDVRQRIGDCAEYIDVVIDEARKLFDYVIVDVRNYLGGSLASVAPLFGYMEREFPESNPIWVPKTVQNSFLITSQTNAAIIIAFDLNTMEYCMLDIDTSGTTTRFDMNSLRQTLFQYMEPPKLSVYDLLSWHVLSRGGEILPENEQNSAETVFRAIDFSENYVNIFKYMAVD